MRSRIATSDNRFTVDGYSGIAWYCAGVETEPDEDTVWSGYEQPTGNVLMVMVGDDRKFSVDPEDCVPLEGRGLLSRVRAGWVYA